LENPVKMDDLGVPPFKETPYMEKNIEKRTSSRILLLQLPTPNIAVV
jgi:hypothetical protein